MQINENTANSKPKKRNVVNAILTVKSVNMVSGHFIEIKFGADKLLDIDPDWIMPHLKLLFPIGELVEFPTTNEEGKIIWQAGLRERVRTYSIRHYDPNMNQLTVHFVIHKEGIASNWAQQAKKNDQIGLVAVGSKNRFSEHSNFVFFGDMAALPSISYTLERMPKNSQAIAYIEIENESARQPLNILPHLTVHWIVNPANELNAISDFISKYHDEHIFDDARILGGMETTKARLLRNQLKEQYPHINSENKIIVSYWRKGFAEGQFKHSD